MSSEIKENNQPISEDLSPDALICLAEIVAPHGVRGAVRIKSFTKDPSSIFDYPEFFDDQGKSYKIKYFATKQNGVFVATIPDVTTCNGAEALRGTKLHVKRSQLPTPPEDEFYYNDLLGLMIVTAQGEKIGTVLAVQNHGAGDFLDIKSPEEELFTILFTKEAVPHVDITQGQIIINKDFLLKN